MTPAARLSAAITVLDRVLAGEPAEQALTNWGRASRFAGSGDRHAVRDVVYDALRCKRSYAALGGGMTGRGLVLGGVRAAGQDADTLFSGQGHAPAPIGPDDLGHVPQKAEALDIPEWIYPSLMKALGEDCEKILEVMRQRAPVFLRVNPRKASRDAAAEALLVDGIVTRAVEGLRYGLEVTESQRKIHQSTAYGQGLVELQDASSQAVIEALDLQDGLRVLDLCAGGGGKTLAMAGRARLHLYAHDADPDRMRDLGPRSKRAGVDLLMTRHPEKTAPYDLILADVPCSGSGSWRRDPLGKWRLTAARLQELCDIQAGILARAAAMLGPNGKLAYVTCSLLREENEDQIDAFLGANPDWICTMQRRFSPLSKGDGFFLATLSKRD